jgi:hypothetical protein
MIRAPAGPARNSRSAAARQSEEQHSHPWFSPEAYVPDVGDVRGVAASAVTGKLYVAYRNSSGIGMIYCLNVYTEEVLWNRAVNPGVDRLSINPDGQLLYVPTWEGGSADYINVLDARIGDVVRKVYFSNRSHDTQYPLSGPIFQETKADDGSGNYLYLIDPSSYAVSHIGPYSGILGPYAVDGMSRHVVNNVAKLWGMQVADMKTGQIVTANIPYRSPADLGLLHGIGWTPDQTEVWEGSTASDPHIYVWDMLDPMVPVLKERLTLRSGRGNSLVDVRYNRRLRLCCAKQERRRRHGNIQCRHTCLCRIDWIIRRDA